MPSSLVAAFSERARLTSWPKLVSEQLCCWMNQLAKAAAVDQSALNRFLNGTRNNIRIDVADKLMRVLGLGVAER